MAHQQGLGQFQRFTRDTQYYEAHQQELLSRYPDQWIAIYNEQVVAAAQDPGRLLDELVQRGIPVEHALVEHLSSDEEVWILPG